MAALISYAIENPDRGAVIRSAPTKVGDYAVKPR